MTAENSAKPSVVGIDELKEDMVILSYLGFHSRFKRIDEKVCQWLRHNFRGVCVQAVRNDRAVDIPIEKLLPGDTIVKLYKFPPSLKKLTQVNRSLTKELKSRGFLKFRVVQKPRQLSPKQREIKKINRLIEKIKKGEAAREQGTKAVENLLDRAREGKTDTDEIVEYIQKVSADSSMDAIAAMASLKESDQTYAHCIDVGAIFFTTYFEIIKRKGRKSIFKDDEETLFASFLHDFGKFKVPKEILDSTVRFDRDSEEMKQMFNHPVYGKEVLQGMGLPEYIVNMAHLHHVKVNPSMGSSYPKISDYGEVLYETRLLAIVDIYQALIGKRSYKKSWTPPSAIRYIDTLAGLEHDMEAWKDFLSVVGKYPIGSLVELSDGAAAFVVTVPKQDLDSPQVVRVLDVKGNIIPRHVLTDLQQESKTIVKDLDCSEVLGVKGLEVFSGMRIT